MTLEVIKRSDALAPGSSYPAITLTVNVAANAPASVTNVATVSGGRESNTANDTASNPTTILFADLTVAKSHSGNFMQTQTGAAYSISVSNVGTGSTSGAVTLVDTLPSGLTATAISGTGWTCTLATLTCTRSDALAPGASYPAITLTVNVAGSAPASVTNVATVSGGSDANTANNTASNPTTIVPLAPVRVFLTSGTSWAVPSNWNSAQNTIEVIGGGSGGGGGSGFGGGGGGGGAYSKTTNVTLTAGATATYQIGQGGGNITPGGDTWFNGASLAASSVGAKGGAASIDEAQAGGPGSPGGAAGSGIGTTRFSGGAGGTGDGVGGSGAGGGAAGPNGNGGDGGSGDGAGDGGAGGSSVTAGGGAGGIQGDTVNGQNGGTGTDWDSAHGAGGGGGGGAGIGFSGGDFGGNGGSYGGGGAGGSTPGTGGQGIIVITYLPKVS